MSLLEYPLIQEQCPLIPYAFAKKHLLIPLQEEEEKLLVAIADSIDLATLEEARFLTGKELKEIEAPVEEIEAAIEACYDQKEGAASDLIASLDVEAQAEEENDLEGYDLLNHDASSPVIKTVNAMLMEAIQQGASDVHFDPQESGLSVRYRIDGVLQARHVPPKEVQAQILTRLKVMASLDIAEKRLPQDGRMKLRVGGREIDFRVSTIPVAFGERIVLRILDRTNVVMGLKKIGMDTRTLKTFTDLMHLSEGIVLVTGPTGSGKTTSLYSAISELNSDECNIMTIEDPVEYKLQGIAQIGVNPKIDLTFAKGLRHILRQDPDIIMVGEIRDRETAEVAIQAALTGHLVLTTLHTNDAPSALTRLVDMGIEPYLISSTVLGVLAQRLVRKFCIECKGEGCEACFNSGFQGRHGIYELMPMTDQLKRLVVETADASRLKEVAIREGMQTLHGNGAKLVESGITSMAEVLRVAKEI